MSAAGTQMGDAIASGGSPSRKGPPEAARAAGGAARVERFDHRCADAKPLQVQAYAEIRAKEGRGKALVLVYARRDAVHPGEIFIGLRLVAMRIEAGREGARASWSVRLEARTETLRHVGTPHSHYISNPSRREGRRRAFRSDETGALDWLDYVERNDRKGRGGFPCNWSPRMETRADDLGLAEESRVVALGLVLTEARTGSVVRLSGATIRIPDRMWRDPPARSKFADLLAMLSPFDRGARRKTLAGGARCRKCIVERRSAKRCFASQQSVVSHGN